MKLNSILLAVTLFASVGLTARSVITPAEAEKQLNARLESKFQTDTLADGNHLLQLDSLINVRLAVKDGKVTAARRQLFSQPMLESTYGTPLRYIEEAALYNALSVPNPRFDKLTFIQGTWLDITPGSEIQISVPDRNEIQVAWITDSTTTELTFPVQYQDILGGERAEIENSFIDSLRTSVARRATVKIPEADALQPADSTIWILPGTQYNLSEVNNNLYFTAVGDSLFELVNSREHPVETLVNMLSGSVPDSCDATVELVAIKHKYGDKEVATVGLEQLIALAEKQGCRTFVGIEDVNDKEVSATVFLYNQPQGYDHILRLTVPTVQLGTRSVKMKGRMSLFVPTSNVQNIFEPYKAKSPDERIKFN